MHKKVSGSGQSRSQPIGTQQKRLKGRPKAPHPCPHPKTSHMRTAKLLAALTVALTLLSSSASAQGAPVLIIGRPRPAAFPPARLELHIFMKLIWLWFSVRVVHGCSLQAKGAHPQGARHDMTPVCSSRRLQLRQALPPGSPCLRAGRHHLPEPLPGRVPGRGGGARRALRHSRWELHTPGWPPRWRAALLAASQVLRSAWLGPDTCPL